MMESADDNQKLKITQEDFIHTDGMAVFPHQTINPMTLFAYSGDQQTDCFANAFSTSAQLTGQQTFVQQGLLRNGYQERKL